MSSVEALASSATKSPRLEPSSSPTGVSRDTVSPDACISSVTRFSGIPTSSAISSVDGSRPSLTERLRWALRILFTASTMWTGSRMVLDWSARDLVMDCFTHQVA